MIDQTLDRWAERGTTRGPDQVWEAARAAAAAGDPDPSGRPGRSAQRVALWAAVLVAIAVAGSVVTVMAGSADDESVETGPAAESGRGADPPGEATTNDTIEQGLGPEADAVLPPPILIDGYTMTHVEVPADDDCCGHGLLDSVVPQFESGAVVGEPSDPVRIQVFATSDDPAAGPVLGLTHLRGGGFRPWGANLGDVELTDLTAGLTRNGERWVLDPASGLVEVSDETTDLLDDVRFGWHLVFDDTDDDTDDVSGAGVATLRSVPEDRLSLWTRLGRFGGESDRGAVTFEPITTGTGAGGVLVTIDGLPAGEGNVVKAVFWEEGGWIHRLAVDADSNDNPSSSVELTPVLDRLTVVDREVWLATVAEVDQNPVGDQVGRVLTGVVLPFVLAAAWALAAGRWLAGNRRPYTLVLMASIGAVALTPIGPDLPALIGLVVGSALAWTGSDDGPGAPAPSGRRPARPVSRSRPAGR